MSKDVHVMFMVLIHVPELYCTDNNMYQGPVPPELMVHCYWILHGYCDVHTYSYSLFH